MKFKSIAEFEQTLDEKQREIFRQARKEKFEADVVAAFEALSGFDRKDMVKEETGPITIIDSEYDGPEDKADIISLNPDHPFNQFSAFLMKKYGRTFGLLITAAFMFSKKESKWLLDIINTIYAFDDGKKDAKD